MATILTNKFKVRNAKAFMELFRTNNVYMFIGRNRAWPKVDNVEVTDTPSNLTALSDELDVWNDIIAMQKVSISDVSLVIPRYDWVNTTSYTEYEHDKTDLFSRDGDPTNPFYVVKQEYSGMYTVWKVVANVQNVASTSEPTWANGLSATHFRNNITTDGYLWKYMYRISSTDMSKFGTTSIDSTGNKWMPVKNITTAGVQQDINSQWDVQRQAVHGGVHFIRPSSAIVSGDVNKKVRLDGDGSDFDSTIRLVGSTYYVDIDDPGKNYTYVRRVMKETGVSTSIYAEDTYGFVGESFEIVDARRISLLKQTVLNKYDPNRGSKAFSYFSVITKNWFIHKVKKNSKSIKIEVSFDDVKGEIEAAYTADGPTNIYESWRQDREFWMLLWSEIDKWDKLNLRENERKVLEAIKVLLNNIDEIEIFNKKAIYLYMREITGLNTKQIVSNLNRIRARYAEFKKQWDSGEV